MNKTLNGWKFIFSILIVCHHATCFFHDPHFWRAYLAVEFFFIVSGLLLAKKWYEKSKESPFLWVKRKVIRIYPIFLYSISLLVLVGLLRTKNSYYFICSNLDLLYELLFLNSSGITTYAINDPDWYVSSMLLAGFFYMAIFLINKKLLILVVPAIIISGISFIVNQFHTLNIHSKLVFTILDTGLIRALVDMGIGICTYYIISNMKTRNNRLYNSISEIILCCFSYLFLINSYQSQYDILIIPIFVLLVAASFKQQGIISIILESRLFQFFTKFSTSLYLTHFVVVRFIQYRNIRIHTIKFVAISLLFAMISYYTVDFITAENNNSILRRKLKFIL